MRADPNYPVAGAQQFDGCLPLVYSVVMSTTVEKIVSEALSLPPQARAFVAEKLIESLDAEPEGVLSPAWGAEVRKRCREVDEGLVELRDADDVFAKAYSALG